MTTTQLTPAQHAILAYAINTCGGKIDWFPDHIKGGARKKVLDGMFNHALITPDGEGWCVAAEGYDALGLPRSHVNAKHVSKFEAKLDAIIANAEAAQDDTADADAEIEAAVAQAEASFKTPVKAPRTRDNSKQAEVIRMLQRPEGATIAQICSVTGWQAHTVRGTFAGAFKKKLGLEITSSKEQGSERIYTIAG
jgi:outer membrane murein-binding lipoprotein Lpp